MTKAKVAKVKVCKYCQFEQHYAYLGKSSHAPDCPESALCETERESRKKGVVSRNIFEEIQEQCVSPDRCQGNCTGICQLYNHDVDINDL